jgi:hypothetical protein
VEEVKIVANSAILTVQGSAIPKCPQMLLNALRVIDMHFLFFVFFQFFIGLLLILLLQVAAGILGAAFKSEVGT